eukprot:gene33015-37292_t
MFNAKVLQPKSAIPSGWDFTIKWSFESRLRDSYITRFSGDLMLSSIFSDEDPKKVGFITCVKVQRANIVNNGDDIIDICDSESKELYDLARATEKDEEGEDNDEMRQGDLVYVRDIEVDHAFRGIGLGLFMLSEAHFTVNSCMSMTVLKPYPLQHQTHVWTPFKAATDATLTLRRDDDNVMPFYTDEKNLNRKRTRAFHANNFEPHVDSPADLAEEAKVEEEKLAATKKLQDYYGLLGFKPFKMNYYALWSGYMSPSLREVCPHFYK